MTDIVFRIVGDDAGVGQLFTKVDKTLEGLEKRTSVGAKGFADLAKSSALTRQQMQTLNYTVSDVVASLGSGISPMTVLLQQGPQVTQAFGGVANTFRALGSSVGLAGAAFVAAAVAMGSGAIAAYQGAQEQARLRTALFLTGNTAAFTAGTFDLAAENLARLSGRPIGDAREALEQLAASGQFGANTIEGAGMAVLNLERLTGKSKEEIIKSFAGMNQGVAKWAAESNRAYNFLTVEQYKYIRTLEAQGKTQQAIDATFDAFNQKMGTRLPKSLGILSEAWESVAKTASRAWDEMKGLGRAETTEEALAKVQARLEKMQPRLEALNRLRDRPLTRGAGGQEIPGAVDLRQLEAELQEKARLEKRSAEMEAAQTKKNAKDIAEQDKAFSGSALAVAYARESQHTALARMGLDQRRRAQEIAYRLDAIGYRTYSDNLLAIERERLDAEEDGIRRQMKLGAGVLEGTPAQVQQQQAAATQRNIALQTQLLDLVDRRAQLEADIAAGKYDVEPRVLELPTIGAAENAGRAALEEYFRDRRQQATEARQQLLDINRGLSIGLITDDRRRAQAQIDLDVETLRKRLDLAVLGAEERARAEDLLLEYRKAREAQATRELKPEWERQLDLYRDGNALARDSFNTMMNNFTTDSREAFVNFMKTGKFSAKAVVDNFRDEFARLTWKKYFADPASQAFEAVLGAFGLGREGKTSGGGFGAIFSSIGNLFSGFFADGGHIGPGRFGIVGERGPELAFGGSTGQTIMPIQLSPAATAGPSARGAAQRAGSTYNFGPTYIGSNLSRAEVIAGQRQVEHRVFARLQRLEAQGKL